MIQAGIEKNNAIQKAAATEAVVVNNQQLITQKFVTHTPKSGLNPLVDAAAYLFSILGKLKQLKSYRQLAGLHKELLSEINNFQEAARTQGYSSEYILASRYAICATLDDIISNTSWGTQGQWDSYSLLVAFNPDNNTHDRFFIILERIAKDPAIYIDLMEFLYICLSLGFKGSYRSTEFNNNQLENITHSLYKQIRTQRGDFNKTLAPYPIRANYSHKKNSKKTSITWIALVTSSVILLIFIGLSCMLNTISNQAYQELTHIGKTIIYEN